MMTLLALILGVVTLGVMCFVYPSTAAFLAGLLATATPVIGLIVPAGYGSVGVSAVLATILCLSILSSRHERREQQGVTLRKFVLLPAALLAYINFVDLVTLGETPNLAAAPGLMIAVLLVAIAVHSGQSGWTLKGMAVGLGVVAAGEAIRVLMGGQVHVLEAAFGANPNVIAQLAGLLALLGFMARDLSIIWRGGAVLVGLAGIMASGSRGPLFAVLLAIAVVVVFGLQASSRRGAQMSLAATLLSLPFVIGSIMLLPVAEYYARTVEDYRNETWAWLAQGIMREPLLGVGPAAPRGPGVLETSHNIFLEAWAIYGLLPFLLLLLLLFLMTTSFGSSAVAIMLFTTVSYSVSGSISTTHQFWLSLALAVILSLSGPKLLSQEADATNTPPQRAGSYAN